MYALTHSRSVVYHAYAHFIVVIYFAHCYFPLL